MNRLPEPIVIDSVELDFEIVSEGWSKYKLEDGTTFKMRSILVEMRKGLSADPKHIRYMPYFNIAVNYISPEGLRGKPNIPNMESNALKQFLDKLPQKRLIYEVLVEPWNEYLLEDGTEFRSRFTMDRIARVVDKWTSKGYPAYSFNVGHMIAPIRLGDKK